MRRHLSATILMTGLVLTSKQAVASGVSGDGFSFVFNGVATLAILVSAMMVLLGYKLMSQSTRRRKDDTKLGSLVVRVGKMEMNLANAAPGVIFAALGCVGIIVALFSIIH